MAPPRQTRFGLRRTGKRRLEPNRKLGHYRYAMVRPIPVLINRSGGTAAAMGATLASAVGDAFAATGRTIILELLDGDEVAAAARRHAGAPVVVVGGGDGTIGAAAAGLAHSASALAVLPLGTRNHFARQLGLPLDLPGA